MYDDDEFLTFPTYGYFENERSIQIDIFTRKAESYSCQEEYPYQSPGRQNRQAISTKTTQQLFGGEDSADPSPIRMRRVLFAENSSDGSSAERQILTKDLDPKKPIALACRNVNEDVDNIQKFSEEHEVTKEEQVYLYIVKLNQKSLRAYLSYWDANKQGLVDRLRVRLMILFHITKRTGERAVDLFTCQYNGIPSCNNFLGYYLHKVSHEEKHLHNRHFQVLFILRKMKFSDLAYKSRSYVMIHTHDVDKLLCLPRPPHIQQQIIWWLKLWI